MILNLDSSFKPINGKEVSFQSFTFSGGEPHIRIEPFEANEVIITHRINSFNDLGLLCIAVDAVQRLGVKTIDLILPYFPAARQDRLMTEGESLSVKVYADIINNFNLRSIKIFDPHSEVTAALLNNCTVIENYTFVKKVVEQIEGDFILISPDAGASKKIFKLAANLKHSNVLECGKKRDTLTGKLSGFTVPTEDLENTTCLIVDDICDGGGTFIGLAKELKDKNAGVLFLAVSHGIFSKGTDELNNIFTKIFTTDSVQEIVDEQIHQIKLNQILN